MDAKWLKMEKVKITRSMILLGILMGVFIAIAMSVNAQSYLRIDPIVNLSLIKQEPDPAGPGTQVELRFRVENRGGLLAKDVQLEFIPEYPFSLRPAESPIKDVGTLESFQKGNDGAIATYKLLIDKDAPDGEHEVKFRYREGQSGTWAVFDPFVVRVRSHVAIIGITKVSSVPASIGPGDKAKLSIEMKNFATSLLKDIQVRLDLSATSLNPSGFSNELVISSIAPQGMAKAEFDLIANPNAQSGIEKIPIFLTYSDATGKNYSKANTISMVVGDVPDISVTLDSTDIYTKGAMGNVVIRVVNKGTTDVKFMNVRLQKIEHAEIIGAQESYVGNLDSDDFSTAEFRLYLKDAKDMVKIPVVVEYKDANNNNYLKESSLNLKLYSSSEAKKITNQGNGSLLWIVLLIAAVGGFFLYRRWKKRKDQKH